MKITKKQVIIISVVIVIIIAAIVISKKMKDKKNAIETDDSMYVAETKAANGIPASVQKVLRDFEDGESMEYEGIKYTKKDGIWVLTF